MKRAFTRVGITLVMVMGTIVFAQQNPGGKRNAQRAARARLPMQMRPFDKNSDLYIAEGEFREQFEASLEATREAFAKLVALFDEDGDSQLNQTETRKARQFLWTLMGSQRFDPNRDLQIAKEEEEKAWTSLMEAARQYNQYMVDRFDKDGDGKLSPEESAAGQKAFQKRRGRK